MNTRAARSPVALIVSSHHPTRSALRDRIRARFANLQLYEAASIADGVALLDEINIDIVLIDDGARCQCSERHTRDPCAFTRGLRHPHVPLSEPSCRSAASSPGAMAFVSKRSLDGELMQVLAICSFDWRPRTGINLSALSGVLHQRPQANLSSLGIGSLRRCDAISTAPRQQGRRWSARP